jgi:hypothetical protein
MTKPSEKVSEGFFNANRRRCADALMRHYPAAGQRDDIIMTGSGPPTGLSGPFSFFDTDETPVISRAHGQGTLSLTEGFNIWVFRSVIILTYSKTSWMLTTNGRFAKFNTISWTPNIRRA